MDTQEPPPSLLSLPNEMLSLIVEHLWRWQDAAALSHTCKRLRWLAQEVFRRWDLEWKDEKAWLCLTRPDEVRASEVPYKGDWCEWWERVCDTGTWDLLDWLASHSVPSSVDRWDVWLYAWRCAKHEDGVWGFRWAVEHFGAPPEHTFDTLVAAEQRWASKALPYLMDDAGVEVDVQEILAFAKHEATVTCLVDRGAFIESEEGLMACASCGDTEGVERALAAGVDVNSTVYDQTALHVAKDGEMVRLLVSRGANLEARASMARTPLLVAAKDGRASALVALQECGADAQASDKSGRTTLHFAAQRGDKEMLVKCLEWGLDVNGGDFQKPLHFARNGETVHLLVVHGADVGTRNQQGGYAPLHDAALDGRLSAMEALRACGADIDPHDDCGRTPLHLAARDGRPKAVVMLLTWGLQVDARKQMQETPLHCAVSRGPTEARVECIYLLLTHGADPEARDARGRSVWDIAREEGRWPQDMILRVFGEQ